MHFGLSVFGHHERDRSPAENFQLAIEHVQTASDVGFDYVLAGHHYVMSARQKFQVMPAMSRLAADAGDMHVGMCLLLPLHHPVEIAEQYATLDAITNGRSILAPVAGYRDEEFDAFGIDKAERAGRLQEGVEIIKRLWTEDDVTYDGKFYQLEDVTIEPKPVQNPRPPIWIGANRDGGVKRANELGDAWYVNPHDKDDVITRQLDMIDPPEGDGLRSVQPMSKPAFVAETDGAAFELYEEYLIEFYDWYKRAGQHEEMETPEAIDLQATDLERFLIGSPETVVEKVIRLNEELGIDCLTVSGMHQPKIDPADVRRSIELFGTEVIPAVEAALA